jgi:hypothetical protein
MATVYVQEPFPPPPESPVYVHLTVVAAFAAGGDVKEIAQPMSEHVGIEFMVMRVGSVRMLQLAPSPGGFQLAFRRSTLTLARLA